MIMPVLHVKKEKNKERKRKKKLVNVVKGDTELEVVKVGKGREEKRTEFW